LADTLFSGGVELKM